MGLSGRRYAKLRGMRYAKPGGGRCSSELVGLRRRSSEQLALTARRRPHLAVGSRQRLATAGRALDVALHDEEGFVHILDGRLILPYGHRERRQTHRAAVKLVDHRLQQALVHLIEAVVVNVEHPESSERHLISDAAVGAHLSVSPHPAQQGIGHAGRAARAAGGRAEGALYLMGCRDVRVRVRGQGALVQLTAEQFPLAAQRRDELLWRLRLFFREAALDLTPRTPSM